MANKLPPLQLQIPLVDKSGLVSKPWVAWFRETVLRIGGTDAATITELQQQITVLQGQVAELQTQIEGLI